MDYREHAPHQALRPFVACYWTLRGQAGADGASHRVLPDGSLDLLFDFADGAGETVAHVVGVMTTAIVTAPRPVGAAVDLLGVRFRPGEAPAFLAASARATRDAQAPLRDVCGAWGRDLFSLLRDADSTPARLRLLDAALLRRERRFAPDRRLRAALAALGAAPASVAALAAAVGLGERQLLRIFDEHVGLGPKAYARLVRMQALVRALDGLEDGRPRWAELAVALGFADQAHLIRDVVALTGLTPAALVRERARGLLSMSENVNPTVAGPSIVSA